ncbi:hypothetical protein KY289_003966 [Solanum tuberosum]|nr:hypothetical protein KY284_003783 [Solanum tuberosum]KAH0732778.1 hypothetical protein KY289_003966 [Solanum tuberosum]
MGGDFVDMYVIYQISSPLIVEDLNEVQIAQLLTPKKGIDAGFEDINKNKRERYEGKLGGDDLYFDRSDPGSDISEDEGDPVESDARNSRIPRKKMSTDSDEPSKKKKFGKATRKGRKMNKNFGHNKKGCPIAKIGYTTGTATGGSGGATISAASTGVTSGATGGSGGATTSATSTGVTAGGSGGAATKRPVITPATSRGATTAATCTNGSGGAATKRPATT